MKVTSEEQLLVTYEKGTLQNGDMTLFRQGSETRRVFPRWEERRYYYCQASPAGLAGE